MSSATKPQATILPPQKPGMVPNITAFIRTGGRGVVGNTTFAFYPATFASAVLAIAFAWLGHPQYSLAGMVVPYVAYFVYFFATWYNAPRNPDPAMTGDADYVGALVQRHVMTAKNATLVTEEPAIVGASENMKTISSIGGTNGT